MNKLYLKYDMIVKLIFYHFISEFGRTRTKACIAQGTIIEGT